MTSKTVIKWLIAGIILRLVVMPFSIHPDLRGHYLGSYFIVAKGQLLGFYDYISRLPRTDPLVQIYGDFFLVYSPLTYLFHAAYLTLVAPIFPWDLYMQLVSDIGRAVHHPQIYQLIFILKLPYLFVDLACLWLMLRLVEPKKHTLATILWVFNLPVIYSAFLIGQFDILLVAFILLALFFLLRKNRPEWAAVSLALAASFKLFPLLLVPFLPGNKLKNLLFAALTYLLVIAPYLPSPGFRQYALVAQHSDKMWFAKIMVSGSQFLPLFAVGYVLLFWLNWFKPRLLPAWAWLASPLLLFYSVTHYHPQWFAWATPFLFLAWINQKKTRPLIIALLLLQLGIILSFESSLNFGLFGINFYPWAFVNRFYPADLLVSLIRGGLAGTSLALIYTLTLPKSRHEDEDSVD